MPAPPVPTHELAIDWANDGAYSGADIVTARTLSRASLTASRGRDQIRALTPPMAGRLDAELLNTSQDYSVEYASSPLAGNLLPGRPVRWRASSYEAEVLQDSPVAYWRLGEAGGTSAADRTGRGHTGTYTGGVTLGAASGLTVDPDTAATFDGADDYISIPDHADFAFGSAMSVEAMIYPTTVAGNAVVVNRRTALNVGGFTLQREAATMRFWVYVAGAWLSVQTGNVLSVNTWYHVLATYDTDTLRLWVNNAAATPTVSTPGNINNPGTGTTPCEIGRQTDATTYWTGRLDEIALYNTALSAARVARHYNAISSMTLWTGRLDDLPQHPERTKRSVSIPALGTLSKLAGQKVSTALYSNITISVALGHLLDAVSWPAGDRVIDTGKTTLQWWWLDDEDAFAAAAALWATEGPGANLYEDGQGRIVFESRHYRLLTARCTTSQATFRDTGAEPLHAEPFVYNTGWKDIINACTVTQKVRSAKALGVVWSLGTTVSFGPNEVRKFKATASDPFTAAVAPVAATDYTVASGSIASATLDRTSGASCTITLTAGASGASITGLQLRAQSVSVDNTTDVVNTADASASQTAYGVRPFALSVRAEMDVNVCQDFCNVVVQRYKDPRPTVRLTLGNAQAARLTEALTRAISDRITVVESHTGLTTSDEFFVESIRHQARAGLHLTEFGCEKAGATPNYAVWGTSEWGEDLWGF